MKFPSSTCVILLKICQHVMKDWIVTIDKKYKMNVSYKEREKKK